MTFTCILTELSPIVAVIVAEPLAFAVILPVAETLATEVFELFHITLSSVSAERRVPSWINVPLFYTTNL